MTQTEQQARPEAPQTGAPGHRTGARAAVGNRTTDPPQARVRDDAPSPLSVLCQAHGDSGTEGRPP